MSMSDFDGSSESNTGRGVDKDTWLCRAGKWGAISTMAYFLIAEHRAHVVQFLPYALLLACPLMRISMHHGHRRPRPARIFDIHSMQMQHLL